jgi:hypothetical protein
MTNPSFYDVFERMWQYILVKCNNYVQTEELDTHASNMDNPHGVTKEQIGLENVDNTSDLDKPISYAVQSALIVKANSWHTHDASNITSGVLYVANGGTGYSSMIDNNYTTARYRASALYSTETAPHYNGSINWVYE